MHSHSDVKTAVSLLCLHSCSSTTWSPILSHWVLLGVKQYWPDLSGLPYKHTLVVWLLAIVHFLKLSLVKYAKTKKGIEINVTDSYRSPTFADTNWPPYTSERNLKADRLIPLQSSQGKHPAYRELYGKANFLMTWTPPNMHRRLCWASTAPVKSAVKFQCLIGAKNDLLLFKPLHFSHLKPLWVLYLYS